MLTASMKMLNQRRDSRCKYHHNEVLAKRGCWAEPNRAPRITQDHPEVHQQRYHLEYGKYKPRVAGLPAAKGTFGSLGPQLFGDCSLVSIRPEVRENPDCSPFPIRTPRPARPKLIAPSINTRPLAKPRPQCCRDGSVGRAASSSAAAGRAGGRWSHRDREGFGVQA